MILFASFVLWVGAIVSGLVYGPTWQALLVGTFFGSVTGWQVGRAWIKASDRISIKRGRSMILNCRCKNKFQDELHGLGMRVHNQTKQQGPAEQRRWRCTVCEDEKSVSIKSEK